MCEENRKAWDHGPCWCTGFSRLVRTWPTEVGTPACAAPFPPFLAFVCRTPTTCRLLGVALPLRGVRAILPS